ncbi:hypothetical protein LK459_04815 [Gordonia otitidis]|uniref:hypothetical protein n=1 Tax=Gordonia otitidis TaxID=249058 RepID=UPI001D137833|nr:hypothetical protein [Gordonia otitidis]UEA60196.1 hypothetical protein LK459_04815 [Gordonia otitidis]
MTPTAATPTPTAPTPNGSASNSEASSARTDAVDSPAPSTTATERRQAVTYRLSDVALISALLGLLGLVPLPTAVRALLVAAFVFIGPGAAIATWVQVPRRVLPAVIVTLSMSVTTIVAIGAMWSYRWHPTSILVVGCLAVLCSSLSSYVRTRSAPPLRQWPADLASRALSSLRSIGFDVSVVFLGLAVILWVVALSIGLPGVDASFFGLLFSGAGTLLIPAVVLVATAFVIAIARRRTPTAVAALVALIVIERGTTWLGTEVPLYEWTYKHIAVVRYVLAHDLIQPNGTDIYAQWPAFFVTTAWFSDVTGLDPMTLAHAFAPVIHVLIAVIVYSASRTIGASRRVAVTAAFCVEMVNWVAQDYFSPQAWTLVIAYGLLTMLIASRHHRQMGVLAIIPFAAIVPTHQLTPFWALAAAVALVIFRQMRPWWAVAVMIGIAGAYLALNFDAVAPYGILSGGNPVSNATSNVTASGVPAKEITSLVCRALSAGVLLLAGLAAVVGWKNKRPYVIACAIVAFSPLALLLGQSYGGEAIFRVYLYSLLGCGLLVAPYVVAALDGFRDGRRRLLAAAAALAVVVAALAGAYSYFALWPTVVETREQVNAIDRITANTPPGTRIIMLYGAGLPARINDNYAPLTLANPYFDYPLSYELADTRGTFPTPEQLGWLEWKVGETDKPTIVAFTTQSRRVIEYYGEYRPGAPAEFEDIMRQTPGWRTIYENSDTLVLEHDPTAAPR